MWTAPGAPLGRASGGIVVVLEVDGTRGRGAPRWSTPGSTVVANDESTVVILNGATMRVVSAATGAERFTFEYSTQDPFNLAQLAGSVLVVVQAKNLVARDITTGAEVWRIPRPRDVVATSVGNRLVYARRGADSLFSGIQSTTGKTVWTSQTLEYLGSSRKLALTATSTEVTALENTTGMPRWTERLRGGFSGRVGLAGAISAPVGLMGLRERPGPSSPDG